MKETISNVGNKGVKAASKAAEKMGVAYQLTFVPCDRVLKIEADCTEEQMAKIIAAARATVAHSII